MAIDPLWEKFPTITPYNYAENNPLRMIDQSGLAPEENEKTAANAKVSQVVAQIQYRNVVAGASIYSHGTKTIIGGITSSFSPAPNKVELAASLTANVSFDKNNKYIGTDFVLQ